MMYYPITRSTLIVSAFALLTSLSLNIVGITLRFYAYGSSNVSESIAHDIANYPNRLPIALKPAIMVSSESDQDNYGLNRERWEALMHGSRGLVTINNTLHSNGVYQVSIFHQMECLISFRQYFSRILESENPNSVSLSDSEYNVVDECTSYLTQMLLCAGDLSLEPSKTGIHNTNGRRVHAVNPFGVVHQCKDWRPVKEWLDKSSEVA